jgi:ABC-type sugar transport system permease subunit
MPCLREGTMELEATWERTVQVWWAYFWRNLVCVVVAIVISVIVGYVTGIVLRLTGASPGVMRLAAGLLGGVIGLGMSIIPFKFILGKDFGAFRLVLLAPTRVTVADLRPPVRRSVDEKP